MIYFITGTRAQLIKLAPVMVELNRRNIPYRYYSTGQHKETMHEIHRDFGIREPDEYLVRGQDVVTILGVFIWLFRIVFKIAFRDRGLFPSKSGDQVLIHGDTLSTLIGALIGKRNKCRVAHVESGLRSDTMFDPFPEEITRRIVFRLSDVLFCPGDWAVKNVPNDKTAINTYGNTLLDALRIALAKPGGESERFFDQDEEFGVVSIHRTENIISKKRVKRFVGILEQLSKEYSLLFVMHQTTKKALSRAGMLERVRENRRIVTTNRVPYSRFVHILDSAAFVISDGGSNQEECWYLGKPVALLRTGTERVEGLGENCLVSNYDAARISGFVANFSQYQVKPQLDHLRPSSIIVDFIAR